MWKKKWLPGATGSEGGIVLIDEEYNGECRIILERCQLYDAITCGIYGEMVHTAFFSSDDSERKYEEMKKELQTFIDDDIEDLDERAAFYKVFTDKYR